MPWQLRRFHDEEIHIALVIDVASRTASEKDDLVRIECLDQSLHNVRQLGLVHDNVVHSSILTLVKGLVTPA